VSEPDEIAAWLVAAETALGRRDPSWPGGIGALLDPRFLEIGASGRTWTRATIGELLSQPTPETVRFVDFDVIHAGDDCALVTYRTVEPDRVARRVSVWTRTDGTWLLRYHQGTVVPAGTDAAVRVSLLRGRD
jgi:hypothetical protein